MTNVEIRNAGLGIDTNVETVRQLLRILIDFFPVDLAAFFGVMIDVDIFTHSQFAKQRQLLINDRNAFFSPRFCSVPAQLFAVKDDLTAIFFVGTGEYFHQSRFSSAICTDQTMDLTALHHEIHLIQRLNAWEDFINLYHFKNVVILQL